MLHLNTTRIDGRPLPVLIVPSCEDHISHTEDLPLHFLKKIEPLEEFKGKKGDVLLFYDSAEAQIQRVLFVGTGNRKALCLETLRQAAGKAVQQCISLGLPRALFIPLRHPDLPVSFDETVLALAEGALLGNYQFTRYKKSEHPSLEWIGIQVTPSEKKRLAGALKKTEAICEGTLLARQWVNLGAGDKRPGMFAQMVMEAARKKGITCQVMEKEALTRQGFGGIEAVAKGSEAKPRLVVLEYRPEGASRTVVLVGKGVTFDAGGLNLKPTGAIEEMKIDMSGAAAVAATLLAAPGADLRVNVVGILPLVENMPSGSAFRPGDVICTYAGKTVEIGNTDAEGRLILADAMAWGIKTWRPDALIDVATLTGACMVALGEKIAGVFSSDRALSDAIVRSGEATHERCWPLPMPEDYTEKIQSEIADLRNTGDSKWGGAITAALFLKAFAEGTRWAHIDIAGPAAGKKAGPCCGPGGTGFGVRLLTDLLERLYSEVTS